MYSCKYVFVIYFILHLNSYVYCWQYFTELKDIQMDKGGAPEPKVLHSEYRYGHCSSEYKPKLKFYAHVFLSHIDILGKIIIRGWLDIPRIPTCIILRAKSYSEDLFRNTAYNFQICVPRITYAHTHVRYKYFYYEWYLPSDMVGGMDWDIYFFGPIGPYI